MSENRELALVLRLVADQFTSELRKSGGALGEFNRFISDWKTQLATAGGVLFTIAKTTANYGEEALKASQRTGVSVQVFTGLQYAAHLSDLSVQQLTNGLKFLSINMVEAGRRTGDGELLFRRLGIAATDATGQLRPTEAVLLDVAQAFAQSKDGAGKAEMAVKLFGKAGLDLIPFLNQGKTGIRDLMVEAERLGLVLSQQDAEAANRFNDELKKLAAEARGMTFAVGKELIPVMTELIQLFRSFGVGTGLSAGLQFLHERFIGLNVVLKELQANAQFLSGTGKDALSFEGLRGKIAQIEAEGKQKVFESRNPGVLSSPGAGASGAGGGPQQEIAQLVDQEKLGKALVEIWAAGNRAIEIRNKLMREGTNEFFLAFDRQEQFRKEDEAYQESRGRMIVEQTGLEVRLRDEAMAKERDAVIQNEQAWVQYYEQLGGDQENFYQHKMNLLRAQLAKELELTQTQAASLLFAFQSRDSARAEEIMQSSPKSELEKETIELNATRQAVLNLQDTSDDFFAGWARGMANYVKQTGNGFNLATDMARRTAQEMEAGFRNFFFDVMNGKVKSLKDVFMGLLDFAKQIIAQVTAQLVTSQILRFATAGFGSAGGIGTPSSGSDIIGGLFGKAATGGEVIKRFASGGPVLGAGFSDTVPALLTPGEFVLSRNDVQMIRSGAAGGNQVSIGITVNAGGGGRKESDSGGAQNFTKLARDLSALVELKIIEEQRPGGLLAGGRA